MNNKLANQLINEKSPYLQQHAYNPVDWYPWGDEAFEKAQKEDKPIFLSIGYSTCHWCHVMEKESFEDLKVAEVLNKYFVSIKVDREERPDIDNVYMNVCQMLTGSGGWPLNLFLDNEKKPFYAGTYFPKHSRGQSIGFIDLAERINDLWQNNRDEIFDTSKKIISIISKSNFTGKKCNLTIETLNKAYDLFETNFDTEFGGFGNAPKFPMAHQLLFLLRYSKLNKSSKALYMVEKTLTSMYKGGIYDHIGFGFSRYSTDKKWLVPHFEKMLYDNALLAIAYCECYQATKKPIFKKVANEIFSYILRDLTYNEGGFYSAEDADSEGEEGKFYVWQPNEIIEILGRENGQRFCDIYDITSKGNFEGSNIPNLIKADISETDENFINICRKKLFEQREKRVHPFKDDKILTSWNGLMIAALSIGGRMLGEDKYILAAKKGTDFILQKLYKDNILKSRYRENEVRFTAYADDYAFLIWGLIELYQASLEPIYLQKAIELNELFIAECWDVESGGFFLSGKSGEQLITRSKEVYDGATPSANAVSAYNLLRLSSLTGKFEYEEMAKQILDLYGEQINEMPTAHSFALIALYNQLTAQKEIVLTAANKLEIEPMLKIINNEYLPNVTFLFYDGENLNNISHFLNDYKIPKTDCLVYICENKSCKKPVSEPNELLSMLK